MNRQALRDAARDTARAKRALAEARDRMALASPVGSPGVIVEGRWYEIYSTLRRHRERLLKIPGVVGFGLGFRRKDDRQTTEPCIIVSVLRKWSRRRSPRAGKARTRSVPRTLSSPRGRRFPVDVIQVGELHHQILGGTSLGRVVPRTIGTIGTFASDLDTPGHPPVALTAMHVSNLHEYPPGRPVMIAAPSPFENDSLPLGFLLRGTRDGIDAMKISVGLPSDAERAIASIGPVRGWRPVTADGDRNTPVRMHGAVSGLQAGVIEEPVFSLPKLGLDPVMLVRISTQDGDSGAAIVDAQNLVLGLLVGELTGSRGLRAFSPIGMVLSVLRCEIPSTL